MPATSAVATTVRLTGSLKSTLASIQIRTPRHPDQAVQHHRRTADDAVRNREHQRTELRREREDDGG